MRGNKMILKTKYFDLETDLFIFKNPEQIKERLENSFENCFTDKPTTNIEYNAPVKISLKYEPTKDYFNTPFPIYKNDLIFSDIGCVNGYKIMNSDYTCRRFYYEPYHTYSIEEDPIPCERGFHFCKELDDCFNYYIPWVINRKTFNLDFHKYFKVKSNSTTYLLDDKYCTNSITILDECSTEEILEAFKKWITEEGLNRNNFKVKLRGEYYEYHDGIFNKVIPGEKPNN